MDRSSSHSDVTAELRWWELLRKQMGKRTINDFTAVTGWRERERGKRRVTRKNCEDPSPLVF